METNVPMVIIARMDTARQELRKNVMIATIVPMIVVILPPENART